MLAKPSEWPLPAPCQGEILEANDMRIFHINLHTYSHRSGAAAAELSPTRQVRQGHPNLKGKVEVPTDRSKFKDMFHFSFQTVKL